MLLSAVLFGLGLGLGIAWISDWRLHDVIWGFWIKSLAVGYLMIIGILIHQARHQIRDLGKGWDPHHGCRSTWTAPIPPHPATEQPERDRPPALFPILTLLLAVLVSVVHTGCGGPTGLQGAQVDLAGHQIRSPYSEGLAIIALSRDLREGYVDTQGAIVIPPRFFQGGRFAEGLAPVQQNPWDPWGFIDRSGAMVIAPRFDAALPFSEGLAPVRIGDRWGYLDHSGALRIPPRFHSAWGFSGGLARVTGDGLAGFIDPAGTWVAEPAYLRAGDFREGLAFVCGQRTCGYLDTDGTVVIDLHFDDAGPFNNGLAPVRIGERWGYVNRSGELVVPALYTEAEPFFEGLARVGEVRDHSYDWKFGGYSGRKIFSGFIDTGGALTFATRIHGASAFSQGLTVVRVPSGGLCSDCNHYRLMQPNGRFLPGRFDRATPPTDGMAIVTAGGRSYAIDLDGRPIIRFDLSIPHHPDDSARRVPGTRYGYIDPDGTVVLPHIYLVAHPFSEGLAYVEIPRERTSRLKGFVDHGGERVVDLPSTVATVLPYSHGLALAGEWIDGTLRYGFLDRNGQFAIPPRFASAAPFQEGLAAVKHSTDLSVNDWGYVDTGGHPIIEPRFHSAGSFSHDLAPVRWIAPPNMLLSGVIDRRGNIVVSNPSPSILPPFGQHTPSIHTWYGRGDMSFGDGRVPVVQGTRRGWVDAEGTFLAADARIVSLGTFSEGLAPVAIPGDGPAGLRWGFADNTGNLAIEARFAHAGPFREGLALVRDTAGRIGFVAPDGTLAVQPMWLEDARPFAGGLALAKLNGRWGYLDRNGDFAIPPRFPAAAPFSEGLAATAVAEKIPIPHAGSEPSRVLSGGVRPGVEEPSHTPTDNGH
jgi:hypothetical protein